MSCRIGDANIPVTRPCVHPNFSGPDLSVMQLGEYEKGDYRTLSPVPQREHQNECRKQSLPRLRVPVTRP